MLREEPIADIFAKRRLGGRRHWSALPRPHFDEPVNPALRPHDIAKPQAWKCQLGKTADRQDVGVRIERHQRGNGPTREAQLAIIVVLDQERATLTGPTDQRQAPRKAELHAQWELARWSDQRERRVRIDLKPDVDAEALVVDRDRMDLKTFPGKRRASRDVGRV